MKWLLLLFLYLPYGGVLHAASPEVMECRELFTLVDQGENYNIELDKLTANATYKTPILFGYRALYYFMCAKYAFWPTDKYANFKMGKKYIDLIIQLNPNEPELRIIRYSVQSNVPAFLEYKSNLEADRNKLKSAYINSNHTPIHALIEGVLKLYP
ncbi:hypothetical protein DNU06_10020 [Putridiphycobacter roseus]|uniref:Uncharacterized protein n=1 Tax=Putridiphycobacter roseus TaxID=2219161 RepID=A0A2W1N288_9FLAO|nr:hypothetical protein [Putridiphycobacter roseus]PZE17071.1 hypothetical protein DNU06_10020 [Putridiphycobacter roseus]